MKWYSKSILFSCVAVLMACVNENDLVDPGQEDPNSADGLLGLDVPDDFSYETTKVVDITLEVPDFLKNAVVDLYAKIAETDSISLGKGTFDENGRFEQQFTLSSRADSLLIFSNYTALVDNVRLPITEAEVVFDYRTLYNRPEGGKVLKAPHSLFGKTTFTYLDTFDNQGVPQNMATAETIGQALLDDISFSLTTDAPDGIPQTHPEYFEGKETQLVLTEEAEVWVTFVSEATNFRNTLGFYSYPIGEAPQAATAITEHTVIFPNVSMNGSKGGLVSGDRVYLGRFAANTVIAWFLVPNGWKGNGVQDNQVIYYSNSDFNPESLPENRQHIVQLHDPDRQLTVLGFEDRNRDNSSDNDFTDAVFYVKTAPGGAYSTNNMALLQSSRDSDQDGVMDVLDAYPTDPNKAFNNFFPSATTKGQLVFEDLWPSKGDYDFNDLVMDYRFNLIANSANQITAIEADFTVLNIGASFRNGFGFALPMDSNMVENIDGQVLNGGYEQVAANGTEMGSLDNEAIILVAGNTQPLEGQRIFLDITLNSPRTTTQLGQVPFNAFLIVNADRGREVHLADYPPTSKARLLATGDDTSNGTIDRFYKSADNLPWAMNIYEGFTAPPENVPITEFYPRFQNWANSGGEENQDWFIRD